MKAQRKKAEPDAEKNPKTRKSKPSRSPAASKPKAATRRPARAVASASPVKTPARENKLAAELAASAGKFKQLKTTLARASSETLKERDSFKKDLTALRERVRQLEGDSEQFKKERKRLETELSQKLAEHLALNKTIERKNSEIFKKERQIESLYHENQARVRQLAEKDSTIEQWVSALKQREMEAAALQSALTARERARPRVETAVVPPEKELQRRRRHLDQTRAVQKSEQAGKPHFMACPKCGAKLKEMEYRQVRLERCSACEGVFMDKGEIEIASAYAGEKSFLGRLRDLVKLPATPNRTA